MLHTPENTLMYGLLGGVGPKSSAAFLNSLYTYPHDYSCEQELPRVVLLSDSAIPDRTAMLLDHRENELLDILCDHIDQLEKLHVDEVVILCFTFHYFHHLLKEKYDNFLSLIDIGLKKVLIEQKNVLLFCTQATYDLEIFSKSSYWEAAKPYILIPDDKDKRAIHHIIMDLKLGLCEQDAHNRTAKIVKQYEASHILVGCTEFHLLSSHLDKLKKAPDFQWIDPLHLLIEHMHLKDDGKLLS